MKFLDKYIFFNIFQFGKAVLIFLRSSYQLHINSFIFYNAFYHRVFVLLLNFHELCRAVGWITEEYRVPFALYALAPELNTYIDYIHIKCIVDTVDFLGYWLTLTTR